jgi:putative phosphoesterase
MELLVFSDSHGRGSNMLEAVSRQIKRPDAIVFLGDGLKDLYYCDFGDIPTFAVCGNCDFYSFFGKGEAEDEIVMTLGGKKIMMVHGDRYGVKSGLGRLVKAASEKGVDIALFGHTHVPLEKFLPAGESEYGIELSKPLYLFNPGSVGGYGATFGCVQIKESGDVVLSHGEL